jgi:hypothetical protein
MPGSHGLKIMDWLYKQHFPHISDVQKRKLATRMILIIVLLGRSKIANDTGGQITSGASGQ